MRATARSRTLPLFPPAPLATQAAPELVRPSCGAGGTVPTAPVHDPRFTLTPEQLATYDLIIVALSGGKDSAAAFLHLLELGVPLEKLELAHHEVDGREGSTLMDWPCTPAYVRAFAAAFGVPVFFSWREGGFEREMLRQGAATAPVLFETPDGAIGRVGGDGDPGTRLKFPMPVANLEQRWCSGKLKTHVRECTQRRGVLALRDRDLAGPPFPWTPVPSRSCIRLEGGRAPLRSDRGARARDDRAPRSVDRPRRAAGPSTGRRPRRSAVRAWAVGTRGGRRRHAGRAAPSAPGVYARNPQAPERTRGCAHARPIDPIHLRWVRCRAAYGAT